jgi:hypothetical protein
VHVPAVRREGGGTGNGNGNGHGNGHGNGAGYELIVSRRSEPTHP